MNKIWKIIFLFGIIGNTFFSCEKDKDEIKQTEGYIIGFDPCEGGVLANGRGFVIACNNFVDTFVNYNLPDTLFEFPQYFFVDYNFSFPFPDSEYLNYKIKFQYRFASEKDKYYPLCHGDIKTWGFVHFVKDRQIIIDNIQILTYKD